MPQKTKLRVWQPEQQIFFYWSVGDDATNFNKVVEYYNALPDQFTSLLDQNGKEIFEGDIVIVTYFNGAKETGRPTTNAEVRYKEDKFYLATAIDTPKYMCLYAYNSSPIFLWSECEVIGNIHENPELLADTQPNNAVKPPIKDEE